MDSDLGSSQLLGGSTVTSGTTGSAVTLKSEGAVLGNIDHTSEAISPYDLDLCLDIPTNEFDARHHEQCESLQTEPLVPDSSAAADGQCEPIQPDPLVQEPSDNDPGEVISKN
jgi:hypothetical protein